MYLEVELLTALLEALEIAPWVVLLLMALALSLSIERIISLVKAGTSKGRTIA